MSVRAIHLNLLQETERLSSSPVRLKVMLPIVFGVILVAMLGWWGFLQLQLGLVSSEIGSLKEKVTDNGALHTEVCKIREALRAKEAELGQLTGYQHGRKLWGETLAAVASAVPPGIQLTLVEIPPPPPHDLLPPPGIKLPPLLGPTNAVEKATFRVAGRAVDEQNVFAFLGAMKASSAVTNALVFAEGSGKDRKDPSPRMRQFRQDASVDADGERAIVFDVEYATQGRNFAP